MGKRCRTVDERGGGWRRHGGKRRTEAEGKMKERKKERIKREETRHENELAGWRDKEEGEK